MNIMWEFFVQNAWGSKWQACNEFRNDPMKMCFKYKTKMTLYKKELAWGKQWTWYIFNKACKLSGKYQFFWIGWNWFLHSTLKKKQLIFHNSQLKLSIFMRYISSPNMWYWYKAWVSRSSFFKLTYAILE
jgi:hypothetical protein